jgi:hypothetical protein
MKGPNFVFNSKNINKWYIYSIKCKLSKKKIIDRDNKFQQLFYLITTKT